MFLLGRTIPNSVVRAELKLNSEPLIGVSGFEETLEKILLVFNVNDCIN